MARVVLERPVRDAHTITITIGLHRVLLIDGIDPVNARRVTALHLQPIALTLGVREAAARGLGQIRFPLRKAASTSAAPATPGPSDSSWIVQTSSPSQ